MIVLSIINNLSALAMFIDYIIQDRYKGVLLGLAVGDVLGTPFEFWNADKVINYLLKHELEVFNFERGGVKYQKGFYTDDTAQTICLAESLLEKEFDLSDQYNRYYKWFTNGYATPDGKCYGAGQQTIRSLIKGNIISIDEMNGQDDRAGGNGSLMRCAPIGLYYQSDYKLIKKNSLLASYVTHNNLIAGWSCVVLNTLISLIINGVEKNELLSRVLKEYSDCPEEIKNILKLNYIDLNKDELEINGYSLNTLKIAIWSFLNTDNFKDCIAQVMLLGNDTDTFGAVVGALAGSYYGYSGIPNSWSENVNNGEHLLNLAMNLFIKRYN